MSHRSSINEGKLSNLNNQRLNVRIVKSRETSIAAK